MVHCTSVAVVDRPLALVAGVVEVAAVGTGVAQIHGEGCTLSRTGPLSGWLVTVSEAPANELSLDVAVTVLAPLARPVTRPTVRPSARVVKALVTSVVPTLTLRSQRGPNGGPTSIKASPPVTMSARVESTGSVVPGNCEVARGAGLSLPPPHETSATQNAPVAAVAASIR